MLKTNLSFFFLFLVFSFSSQLPALCGAESFRFGSPIEARGEIQQHLRQAVQRLNSPPLNDIEFVLSDLHFHQQRRFTEYSGDVSGRMLGAWNNVAPLLNQEIPFLKSLRDNIPAWQKPDGHFGVDQNLDQQISQERDMPILWGNGRLLLALAEYCRDHQDPDLLQTAKKLGDYILSTRKYFGKEENFTQVGGSYSSGFTTCYPSMIDGLVALGEVTGETKYWDEARYIARLSLLDTEFAHHHSHGRLVAYRGMLDLDYLTGSNEFLAHVTAGCQTIREKFLLPTQGVTEIFDLDYQQDEGCSEADWIRVNLLLWRATQDTQYLDWTESILNNHLYAAQFSNGGFGHTYFLPLLQAGQACPAAQIAYYGTESYWCCSMHGTQVLGDIVRWAIVQSENAFWITWLAETRAEFILAGQNIKVAARKQKSDIWQVILVAPTPVKTALKLRIPAWADSILVNGQAPQVENGWANVPCDWTGELKLEVQLPSAVKLAGPAQSQPIKDRPVRICRGPHIFGLPQSWLAREFRPASAVPSIYISRENPDSENIPVIVKGPDSRLQLTRLVPLSRRPAGACFLLFDVETMKADAFQELAQQAEPASDPGTAMEVMFACDGNYEIYLNGENVYQYAGWGASARITLYPGQKNNILAVRAKSQAQRPALMGTIQTVTQQITTQPDQVTVLPCPEVIPPAWLTHPDQWPQKEKVKVENLGGYGDAPWGHYPAQFAGTDARWIWPQTTQPSPENTGWLFCFPFTLPEK